MKCVLTVLLAVMLSAGHVWGQTPDREVRKTVQDTVDIRQETQRREDAWARQEENLRSRYRIAAAQVEDLMRRKAALEKRDAALRGEVADLERRIAESERLEGGLQEVMDETLERLEAFVASDLPFHEEERELRVAALKETLARTDATPAEKLRLLLEALQVETEFGDTVETYPQRIDVDGESVFADIFRLGRLSVFWMTPDGKRVGEYDRVEGRWVELPARYRQAVRLAVEMAAKQRPVELIRLPVGRIHP